MLANGGRLGGGVGESDGVVRRRWVTINETSLISFSQEIYREESLQ